MGVLAACGHLTVLPGGGQSPGAGSAASGGDPGRVVRVPLAEGEWMMVLAGAMSRHERRELASGCLPRLRPWAAGRRVARVPARDFGLGLGAGILHHSPAGTVLYCNAAQIAEQAAVALAGLAARAWDGATGGCGAGFRVCVTRVRHRGPCRPWCTYRRSASPEVGLTGYMCSRLISDGLAETAGVLGSAYARWVAESLGGGPMVIPLRHTAGRA